jgi:CDGSH iron-sulfur domain-containing protein 3
VKPLGFKFAGIAGACSIDGENTRGLIMAEPKVFQKGPIVQKVEAGTYFWCACGASKTQPFCDGSHKGTEFSPKKVEIAQAGTVAWCACKHSKNAPFCDGSHSRI